MISKYCDDDLLALSGIQHFAFCQRQWALIHIEKQWSENLLTIEGKQLHERVDNPYFFESRGGILTARSVPIASYTLGFYGVADMVEFFSVEKNGITLNGRKGLWHPVPIEFKRGRPKKDNIDEVQICAQAMCLEEMLCYDIEYGYLFYGETRHRTKVLFNTSLRMQVMELAEKMHNLFARQLTPKVRIKDKRCKSCSLVEVCLPKLGIKEKSVSAYINKYLE